MNTGRWGERIAAWHLFWHGYRILERNYRWGRYEIDIVARERRTGTLIFAEVKTRAPSAFGLPREAVNEQKQRRLRLAAQGYLKSRGVMDSRVRFDVVEVYTRPLRVTHLPNAF